jgi:hypothetical protein
MHRALEALLCELLGLTGARSESGPEEQPFRLLGPEAAAVDRRSGRMPVPPVSPVVALWPAAGSHGCGLGRRFHDLHAPRASVVETDVRARRIRIGLPLRRMYDPPPAPPRSF